MTANEILMMVFWFFVVYFAVRVYRNYQEFAQEYRQGIADEVRKRVSIVSEEQHDGVYYWFDKDNDQFIAQGRTSEEIVEHIRQRYKTEHIFVLPTLDTAIVAPNCSVVSIDQLTVNLK